MARIIEDPLVLQEPIASLMDEPLPAVPSDASVEDIARLLTRHNPAVLVQDGGAFTGIITRYDLVRQLME
jgi:predicted transcriptional regulator